MSAKRGEDTISQADSIKRASSKLGAERPTPDEQTRPTGRKAKPLTPAEQRRRFEELSRELGTDNGETLDRVFGKIVPAKAKQGS